MHDNQKTRQTIKHKQYNNQQKSDKITGKQNNMQTINKQKITTKKNAFKEFTRK